MGTHEDTLDGVNEEDAEMEAVRQQFLDSMSMELEADFELSDDIVKKGTLSARDGIWGFFFDNEEDKSFILKQRPWLVNGLLLNIRDWPANGIWQEVNMAEARYWVEAHGLPTPYLTWKNNDVVARKVGVYIDFDRAPRSTILRRGFLKFMVDLRIDQKLVAGFYLNISRDRKEWIQFKYHKLPTICFNCGMVGHLFKCEKPTEFAFPPIGKAVPLYGAWIKAGVPIRSCFDSALPQLRRGRPEINRPTRAPMSSKMDKGKKVISANDNDPSMVADHGTMQQINVGEVGSNEAAAILEGKILKLKKVGGNQSLDGCSYLRNTSTMHGEKRGLRPWAHLMNRINNDKRDEGVIMSFMADIEPTRDQMVEIPHEEVCKSRKPHSFPEPTLVEWAINKGLVEVVNEIIDPSKGVNASAQQIITCNDITLASNGPSLTGQKKRKAAEWVIPIVQSPTNEKSSCSLPSLEVACYSAGSKGGVDSGSTSKQRQSKRICASKGRKKATGRTKNQLGSPVKFDLSHETIRNEGKREVEKDSLVEVAIEEIQNFKMGEEAALIKYKPECVFLMETKCVEEGIKKIGNSLGFRNCSVSPAVGNAGGYALLWNEEINLSIKMVEDGVFYATVRDPGKQFEWTLIAAYGTPYENQRRVFWEIMASEVVNLNQPWLLMGDLNVLANPYEKMGGRRLVDKDTRYLRDFFRSTGGIDLGCKGCRFTWQNNRFHGMLTRERLDRAIASHVWLLEYQFAEVTNHLITVSDHGFIVLDTGNGRRKKFKPFWYFDDWSREASCYEVIKEAWKSDLETRNESLTQRCQRTRKALQSWKITTFGNCDRRIKETENRLAWIQNQTISPRLSAEEDSLKRNLSELWFRKESMWKQQSKENWLKLGDRNSKFFHTSTIIRQRRNKIQEIRDKHGHWVYDEKEVAGVFFHFYKDLFTSSNPQIDESFEQLFEAKVTVEENMDLRKVPDSMEIENAIANLHPLKSPGPDGLPGCFYRRHWQVVGDSVIKMVQLFFSRGVMDNTLNFTHICLIPKVEKPESVEKFRPISLCNFGYKIISKILATRLRAVMDKLVSPVLAAFIPGRWIAESSILTQELVQTIRKKKGKGGLMAIKIDMHKAYDRLEWNFILKVLQANGFDEQVCKLLMKCVKSVTYSLLINGFPHRKIYPKRGIRQGDPLSPFLFLLCHEVLAKLLAKAQGEAILKALQVQECSGNEMHLGNPFVFKRRKREKYKRLKESLMKRLEGWKLKLLSFASRATLIQSVALNLPIYTMSSCKVPLSTCRELDALIRKYWWTGDAMKDRYHAVISWDKLCKPKVDGGLWFRRLEDTNQALISKLAWHVASNSNKLWVQCLKAKYCKDQSFWSIEPRGNDSTIWKGILQSRGILGSSSTSIPAKGESIDIWTQPWIPWLTYNEFRDLLEGCRDRFPTLQTVADLSLNGNEWNCDILHQIFGQQMGDRICKITRLPCDYNDMLIWKSAQDGRFTTKRAYLELVKLNTTQRSVKWEMIWNNKLHPRVSMMLWRVLAGCIPVRANMKFLSDKGCVLCDGELESTKHLFWDCPFARALWFSGPFPVGSMNSGDHDLSQIVGHLGDQCKEEERGKFLTFVGTLFDTIWFSRNAVFFRGNQANVMSAIHKMLHKMEEFISVQGNFQDCNDLHQFSREKVWCVPNAVHGFFVTDASWKEGRAGIAVGCQDRQSGKWLWSAKAMDADSAMEAEALAVFWALQLGSECGFSSIAVASDALLLVQSLTALKLPPCWKSRAAVAKIWSLFDVFTSCVFIHLNRIDNGQADALAKLARNNESFLEFKLREGSPFVIPNYVFFN
uniref:Reverse transcriptase domain-containing protein n=1 Tax=Cannabis sativa TaxID=3483 RepID=A0A803PMJ8_CANSA